MTPAENITFADMRQILERAVLEPSAPISENIQMNDDQLTQALPAQNPTTKSAVAMEIMNLELNLNMERSRKDQMLREKQIIDRDFRSRMELLDNEIAALFSKLASLHEMPSTSAVQDHSEPTVVNGLRPSNVAQEGVDSKSERVNGSSSKTNERPSNNSNAVRLVPNPTGLDRIREVNYLLVHHLRPRHALDERYVVVAPRETEPIFTVDVTVGYLDQHEVLMIMFLDNKSNEVMTFQGRSTKQMELIVCNRVIRVVKTGRKQKLKICNSSATTMFKLKKENTDSKQVYRVIGLDGQNIGLVDKRPAADQSRHALLSLTSILNRNNKAAIIASSFLLVDKETNKLRDLKMKVAKSTNKTLY